jgi:hypothetical protein
MVALRPEQGSGRSASSRAIPVLASERAALYRTRREAPLISLKAFVSASREEPALGRAGRSEAVGGDPVSERGGARSEAKRGLHASLGGTQPPSEHRPAEGGRARLSLQRASRIASLRGGRDSNAGRKRARSPGKLHGIALPTRQPNRPGSISFATSRDRERGGIASDRGGIRARHRRCRAPRPC